MLTIPQETMVHFEHPAYFALGKICLKFAEHSLTLFFIWLHVPSSNTKGKKNTAVTLWLIYFRNILHFSCNSFSIHTSVSVWRSKVSRPIRAKKQVLAFCWKAESFPLPVLWNSFFRLTDHKITASLVNGPSWILAQCNLKGSWFKLSGPGALVITILGDKFRSCLKHRAYTDTTS